MSPKESRIDLKFDRVHDKLRDLLKRVKLLEQAFQRLTQMPPVLFRRVEDDDAETPKL